MSNREDRIGTDRATSNIDWAAEVWYAYAHQIAENYEAADGRQVLLIAPAYCGIEQWVYVETNGNPIIVGWIADDGTAELVEDADTLAELHEGGELSWTREHLDAYGFELPDAD